MPAIRITKRIIDPITFVERVGVEFIPRLEDSVLDDQLASSISYLAPKDLVIPPPPPPPPPAASPERYRPPTPPKNRTHGDKDPNNPRATGSNSPRARRGKVPSPGSGAMFSPKGGKRKSLSASLAQIGEDDEMNEASLSDLSGLQTSLHKTEEKLKTKAPLVKSVRFADEVELNEISRLRNSMLFAMFYDSEDLANFRYEAFMEEAGLDMAEFD